ncbi:MAG: hypothetical protein Q9183_005015, partial [Haloplaca sp. 2 TL-2023]
AVSGNVIGIGQFNAYPKQAKDHLLPDATAIYVAAEQAAGAIEEAIEAEIPLIVAVAEHIPTAELMRIRSMLITQSKSRLVGPNSPGIISAIGKCRIGFHPLPCFQAGVIGIVARSGTLSYEAVASTTRAGLGQSLVIGMGGDILAGTDFVDALTLFEHHEETKGIILVGEIGGESEIEAAEWIRNYRRRTENPKPIMALIAGTQAPQHTVMGHAGAIYHGASEGAALKIKELKDLGVVMTNHPSKFGEGMQALLSSPRSPLSLRRRLGGGTERFKLSQKSHKDKEQRRSIHTGIRRPFLGASSCSQASMARNSRRRHSHILSKAQSLEMLKTHGITVGPNFHTSPDQHIDIQIKIDRGSGELSAILDGLVENWKDLEHMRLDQLNPHGLPPGSISRLMPGRREIALRAAQSEFKVDTPPHFFLGGPTLYYNTCKPAESLTDPGSHVARLAQVFCKERIFYVSARLSRDKKCDDAERFRAWDLTDASIGVDNLVYDGTQAETGSTATSQGEQTVSSSQEDAAKDGIVFVKLDGPGTIGTVVNGAGLAMNTVDAIADLGGSCANFLDTGGKATSATVKASFKLVLADPRVKVIFVDIFGGLTLCDMIAEGIMLAYKDLGIKAPVVVRLRGTNEEIGQKMIAESGLPLLAYDEFENAALKAIDLAKERSIKSSIADSVPETKTPTEDERNIE